METVRLPRQGKLATFTTIHSAPSSFSNQIPLIIAIVELEGGVRLTTQVVDVAPEDLRTGMSVRLEFRKIQQDGVSGVISYAHKAVPLPE